VIHWNTVSPLLKSVLLDLMNEALFHPFRLVGGTALSLQLGHRLSVDIDMFTSVEYGSIDFYEIKDFLEYRFDYCNYRNLDFVAMGTYFEVGKSKEDFVKIDLFYTDEFIFEPINSEQVRMASPEEIIAMKLEVINNNGRKKDFWDLHYFLNLYTLDEMIAFYERRYPYNESASLKQQLINFEEADKDFDPVCLLNKEWELIKYDFIEKFS
jgi:predicted nucleotidyltransferase component of viral defense system